MGEGTMNSAGRITQICSKLEKMKKRERKRKSLLSKVMERARWTIEEERMMRISEMQRDEMGG